MTKDFIITIIVMLMAFFGVEDVDLGKKKIKGDIDVQKKTELINYVDTYQTNNKDDKYKQIIKTTDISTGLDYEVHEYKAPDGNIGYQTIIYDELDRPIESIGTGVEAQSRTWTKIYKVPIVTPTST